MRGTGAPSIATDYARSAGTAEYDTLWYQGLGFWGMGLGRTGAVVGDLFGKNKLTLTNMDPPVDWEPSNEGAVLHTKGGDDTLDLDSALSFSTGDRYSVSWRFEYLDSDLSNGGVFRSPGGLHGWWVDVLNDRVWGRHNAVNVVTNLTGPFVGDGLYHDIVISWDGQVAKIFANGALAGETAVSTNVAWTLERFAEQAGDNITARFSEIGVWRRVLSVSEVQTLHQVRLAPAVKRRSTVRRFVAAAGGADIRRHIIPAYLRVSA